MELQPHIRQALAEGTDRNTKAKRTRKGAKESETTRIIRVMAKAGATRAEIAEAMGLDPFEFDQWMAVSPHIAEACQVGEEAALKRVESSLFQRAVGYRHPDVKIFMPANAEEPVYAEYMKHIPADVQAAKFWLETQDKKKWGPTSVGNGTSVFLQVANGETVGVHYSVVEPKSPEELEAL